MTQVDPQTHEASAYLNYAAGDGEDYDGLQPYFALSDLCINEFDGYHELEGVEIDGDVWDVRLNYSKSGIRPRPSDPVGGDVFYEFDVHLIGPGQAKVSFNLSPRYEEMHGPDGDSISLPWQHVDPDEGICVYAQGSNIEIDRYPGLLARAIFEIADVAEIGFYHGYFDQPFSGRITDLERYVRITRPMNEKLIGNDGVMNRLAMHLSGVDGTKGSYKWDNEKVRGHHHVLRHGSTAANELVAHHKLGGQIKSYLPEHPEQFDENDPLFHPKVGAKFVSGRSRTGAVDWSDRREVVQEIDERLLSILTWADIPTSAGGTTYVSDDHFGAHPAADPVPIHSDPLPRLEAEQEHLLVNCLRDMTDSDETIVQEISADGGTHARDLSESTGLSLSTIYRCLERLDGVLESDNGHVQFVTKKLRQEVRTLFDSVQDHLESAADRVASLVDMDARQSASSAFDRWLKKYGAEFDAPAGDDDSPTIRIDTVLSRNKSTSQPMLSDAIDEMLSAWDRDGRDVRDLRDAIVKASVDFNRQSLVVSAIV